MVRLTVVPVIPLSLSEARKTAMFAASSSVMSRREWVLLASASWNCSQVIPDILARALSFRIMKHRIHQLLVKCK